MTSKGCDRLALDDLADYAAGELTDAEAVAIEEHLFACAECGASAAELDALGLAVARAARSGEIGGFVTDAVLNRLAREGVRVRAFALAPGAVVPCAVWDDDEVMALRLRGDFGGAAEFTLSERVGGTEVSRTRGSVAPGHGGEVIFATPAAEIRRLPEVRLELALLAHEGDAERVVGTYTLVHGGSLRR